MALLVLLLILWSTGFAVHDLGTIHTLQIQQVHALQAARTSFLTGLQAEQYQHNPEDLRQWNVHLHTPLSPRDIRDVESNVGLKLNHYGSSFIVIGNQSTLLDLESHPRVHRVSLSPTSMKLHSSLEGQNAGSAIIHLSPDHYSGIELPLFPSCKIFLVNQQRSNLECTSNFNKALVFLSSKPEVMYIEPRIRFSSQNKFAKYSAQSADHKTVPLWDHGLKGQGEIVAHGDSGIDYDSCFFRDPERPVPVGTVDFDHRKIVTYVLVGDGKPGGNDKHGTHTAASLAGNVFFPSNKAIEESLSNYSGMAPEAKLAIYDFGDDGDIEITSDVYHNVFTKMYADTSAKISSNSWGAPSKGYDYASHDVDWFAYDHQDMLMVFAGGNFGRKSKYSTIATPGQAKNALTVGASSNAIGSFYETGRLSTIHAHFGAKTRLVTLQKPERSSILGSFGSSILEKAPLVAPETNGCSPLPEDFAGKVVIISLSKDCNLGLQLGNFQLSNAAMALVHGDLASATYGKSDNQSNSFNRISNAHSGISIPYGILSNSDGNFLLQPRNVSVLIDSPIKVDSKRWYDYQVAPFSSRGPTTDGRLKPDILASGMYVTSAMSNSKISHSDQCHGSKLYSLKDPVLHLSIVNSMTTIEGTSMSTPIVSGHAALIRQYFREGFFPSGVKTPSDSMLPSASLLKALFINSGQALSGSLATSGGVLQVQPPPSVSQGFGQIALDQVIPFADSPERFNLFISDNTSVSTGQHKSFCFRVNLGSRDFKTTLVWMDPPVSAGADFLLVNNLDLTVFCGPSDIYTGNDLSYKGEDDSTIHVWDDRNNVEQVVISATEKDQFQNIVIDVHGSNIPVAGLGGQKFALVATGIWSGECNIEEDQWRVCHQRCNNHGTCHENGTCSCDSGYTGMHCDVQVSSLISVPLKGSLKSGSVLYYSWAAEPNYHTTLVVSGKKLNVETLVQFNQVPTRIDYIDFSIENRTISDSMIELTIEEYSTGTYYVMVSGLCCDWEGDYKISILRTRPLVPTKDLPIALGAAGLGVLLILIVIVYMTATETPCCGRKLHSFEHLEESVDEEDGIVLAELGPIFRIDDSSDSESPPDIPY